MQKRTASTLFFIFCLAFFQFGCTSKGKDRQQTIEPSALKKDLDILRRTLEETHPGLYWYTDSLTLRSTFDKSNALLDRAMTDVAFFKRLLPLIARIRCGHTTINLPKKDLATHFSKLLPFDFFCQKEKVYIRTDYSGSGLEGMEVRSINNMATKYIVGTILESLPADGYNETFKYQLLSNGAFREGYALFFNQPARFTLRCADHSKRREIVSTVQAVAPERFSLRAGPPLLPLELMFIDKSAVLSVNTFEIDTKQFLPGLASIFDSIRSAGVKSLIIDLRQNRGGRNDHVSSLYSYIATTPFLHLKRAERKVVRPTYSEYIVGYPAYNKYKSEKNSAGLLVVNKDYAGTTLTEPVNKNLFSGDVVLLTSGNTTSAAAEFAAIAHHLKRVKIVGEETGGCYYGATGGYFITLKLPNSGIDVNIPTVRIYTAVDSDYKTNPKGHGTLPHYEVIPTISDVLEGRDVQLERALSLVNK